MGQAESVPYPFSAQVLDTLEVLKHPEHVQKAHAWQSLLNEVCRHRSIYLAEGWDVTPIDKLLHGIVLEARHLLHSGQIDIPCLPIRWINVEEPPRCVLAGLVHELYDVSYEIQKLVELNSEDEDSWNAVMRRLGTIMNQSMSHCQMDEDRDALLTIFKSQVEQCPVHAAQRAFYQALEYNTHQWLQFVENELEHFKTSLWTQTSKLSPECKHKIEGIVLSLGEIASQILAMEERAKLAKNTERMNRIIEQMSQTGVPLEDDPNPYRTKIVQAFTDWRKEIAEQVPRINKEAWTMLQEQVLQFYETERGACETKIFAQLLELVVERCPFQDIKSSLSLALRKWD